MALSAKCFRNSDNSLCLWDTFQALSSLTDEWDTGGHNIRLVSSTQSVESQSECQCVSLLSKTYIKERKGSAKSWWICVKHTDQCLCWERRTEGSRRGTRKMENKTKLWLLHLLRIMKFKQEWRAYWRHVFNEETESVVNTQKSQEMH